MSGNPSYTVARYLLDRLAEIGVRHLFGVPGDFNLLFLDEVLAHPTIHWIGTANELNAGYAADAYARCKGAAALLTTFGVGELSAINALAGSFAEYVPVLQIVGAPSTRSIRAGEVLHHTLGDGRFDVFRRMHEPVTAAHAELDPETATAEIDRVIATMLDQSRPGYLMLPTDVVRAPARPGRALSRGRPQVDAAELARFRADAMSRLKTAQRPAVLADFLVDRFGAKAALSTLLERGDLPYATMLLGRGLLDESGPRFAGTYVGAASPESVRTIIEDADVLICAGVLFTDVLTAGFTHRINPEAVIELKPDLALIGGQAYPGVPLLEGLRALADMVDRAQASRQRYRAALVAAPEQPSAWGKISQATLWPAVERFLRPGDVLVAEQGTAFFGMGLRRLPQRTTFLGQPLWGSIGYALPAAFGAYHACPDQRVIALVGDGSALLTVQEIGTMLRDGQTPIILLLNNAGYTVERAIHGPEQPYNDIPMWNWERVCGAMGPADSALSLRAETHAELEEVLRQAETAETLVLIEVILPKMDVPDLLARITRGVAQINGVGA
jgi:indolepyruvate decarboxylase